MPEPPYDAPDPLIAKAIHMAVMVQKLELLAEDDQNPVREAILIRVRIGRAAIRNALAAVGKPGDDPPRRG